MIEEGEMPPGYYRLFYRAARAFRLLMLQLWRRPSARCASIPSSSVPIDVLHSKGAAPSARSRERCP